MEARRIYSEVEIRPDQPPAERMSFGNIDFPRFLVTEETFNAKMSRIHELIGGIREGLRQGTPRDDAGDTHGQYHNELAWYAEQQVQRNAKLIADLGEGLDRAVMASNYDAIRAEVMRSGGFPSERVILTSKVKIQYGGDPTDIEDVMIVAPLDGQSKAGWVSAFTPLAKAIEGKEPGEKVTLIVKERPPIEIKIISIE